MKRDPPAALPSTVPSRPVPETLLLVEDKDVLREMVSTALHKAGYAVEEAPDGSTALRKIRARRFPVILTDLKLPGPSGLEILRAAKELDESVAVIVMTAYGSIDDAVTAMKEGALDFIQKPFEIPHLLLLVARAFEEQTWRRENLLWREEAGSRYEFPTIVGEDEGLKEVEQAIRRVAATEATVLLEGESGTGKELFAHAIHDLSPRRDLPFVTINCAAIPEHLVENELFGHEKGAFTGAGARKIGRAELANRGSLFLDEIGELPPPAQSKLLRLIEEKTFVRIGGTQVISVDLRIITATNRNLKEAVEKKLFRDDLYFRLAAFPIPIPPLRQRGRDVLALAGHFLESRSFWPIPGPATSASFRTHSSAPRFWLPIRRLARMTWCWDFKPRAATSRRAPNSTWRAACRRRRSAPSGPSKGPRSLKRWKNRAETARWRRKN